VPTLPADSAPPDVVMTGAEGVAALIVMVNDTAAECPPAFIAMMEKLFIIAVVGVPDMTPVEVLSESPGGSAPDETAQSVGEFVAESVAL